MDDDINIILGIVTIISLILAIAGYFSSRRSHKENIYSNEKIIHLNEERRRITWSDLLSTCQELRSGIERGFKPDIIFTPCRRGATIANLMFGVGENILMYVGIREDSREEKKFESPPKDYKSVPPTGKYNHYIPSALLAIDERKDMNLLVLDDFVDTGDSLKAIVDFLSDEGFQRDNIKTATIVCSEAARRGGKEPDFFSLVMPPDFYFPWGKAR